MRSLNTLSLISASVWHIPFPIYPMSHVLFLIYRKRGHMTQIT
jgi:hypothetical protein